MIAGAVAPGRVPRKPRMKPRCISCVWWSAVFPGVHLYVILQYCSRRAVRWVHRPPHTTQLSARLFAAKNTVLFTALTAQGRVEPSITELLTCLLLLYIVSSCGYTQGQQLVIANTLYWLVLQAVAKANIGGGGREFSIHTVSRWTLWTTTRTLPRRWSAN